MTIQKKKGIAVLKGVDVVHKLTGEDATIGKEGSTITLSGTIGVESGYGDMVNMFDQRANDIEGAIEAGKNYISQATAANDFNIGQVTGSAVDGTGFNAALSLRENQYLSFTGSNENDRLWAENVHNAASANISAATWNQENSLLNISVQHDADRSTHSGYMADFEARLSDIDNSAVVSNISGIESLIIAASSSQAGDLSGKVIALNTAISTMVSNREEAESLMSAAISTQVSVRVSQQASLQTLVNAENTAKNSLALSGSTAWGQAKADNQSAYTAGDAALSGLIDAEITSRTTKDTSLATRLATAVAAQGQATGSFNPLMLQEETEEAQANTDATNLITAASLAGNVDLLNELGGPEYPTGSVGAEEQNRIAAYSTFADLVDSEYNAVRQNTEAVYLSLRKAVDDEKEKFRELADDSIMDNEMTTFENLVTGSNGHIANLEPRIIAEEGLEDAAVVATDALALAQENRLAALQDHDSDTFLEISAMVSTMSGSEATQLSNDVAAVVGALGTLQSNRTTGDTDESNYLTNTVIANRTSDVGSMQSLIDDADAAMVEDEGEHTAFLAAAKSTLAGEISDWDNNILTEEESSMTSLREEGDAALSAALSTAISTREDIVSTQKSLQEDGDAALSTRLDNLAVSWNGQDMTLSGHLSVGGNLAVSGEVKLGVHTTVPAAYAAGPDNGAIFYLDADDDAARVGFEKGHSWYFCENDVWFASPFYFGAPDTTALFAAMDAGQAYVDAGDFSSDVAAGTLLNAIQAELSANFSGEEEDAMAAWADQTGENPDYMMAVLEDVMKGGDGQLGGGGAFADPAEAYASLEAGFVAAVPFLNAHAAGGTAAVDAMAQSYPAPDGPFANHVEMAMWIDNQMYPALMFLMEGGHHDPANPFPFSGGDVPFATVQGASDGIYAIIQAAMGE